MSDIHIETPDPPEPIAETEPTNVTVVTDTGNDNTDSLVQIASALGAIQERLTYLEEKQTATAQVAVEAHSHASIATDMAIGASQQVSEVGEQAIAAAVETAESLGNEDIPPQREHWFFRKYRVKGE